MATSGKVKKLTNASLKAGIKALREDNQMHVNTCEYQVSELLQREIDIKSRDDCINLLRQQVAFLRGKLMGYREKDGMELNRIEGSDKDHYYRSE